MARRIYIIHDSSQVVLCWSGRYHKKGGRMIATMLSSTCQARAVVTIGSADFTLLALLSSRVLTARTDRRDYHAYRHRDSSFGMFVQGMAAA